VGGEVGLRVNSLEGRGTSLRKDVRARNNCSFGTSTDAYSVMVHQKQGVCLR
jgi:hypothetical protein